MYVFLIQNVTISDLTIQKRTQISHVSEVVKEILVKFM